MFDGARVLLVAVLWWRRGEAGDAAAQHLTLSPQIPVWGTPTLGLPTVGWTSMLLNSPYTALLCKQEGVYPHPEDCVSFYRCSRISGTDKFSYLSFRCAEGTIFSEQGRDGGGCIPGSCTSPVPSGIATSGISSISESPVCLSQGRFPDANNCGLYYECIRQTDGKLLANKQSCFGNSFDASSQMCVSPDMVNGCSPTQYEINVRSNKKSNVRSNAIEYPDHKALLQLCAKFKNKFICADCATLVVCIDHIGYLMPCQGGSVCSMDKDGFSGAVCHPERSKGCDCNHQDILQIDLYDPTKFLNCSSSKMVVKSCPEDSVFDDNTQMCKTLANPCSKSGVGTYAVVNECSRYYRCELTSTGWAKTWFTCPTNTMYNQESQRCENPCEWYYGNFTCKSKGRFSNPTDCRSFYNCLEDTMDSEKFVKVAGVCPDGYNWSQGVKHCISSGTLKNKCVPLTPKPSTCTIPEKKCQSDALTDCVSEHEFCECEDDIEVFPIRCSPCPAGHASNKTGCFPLCSKLLCGENEVCSDKNGQVPGLCTCSPGYVREGGLCKALCSKIPCDGENEVCYDEDGKAPGLCTCAPDFTREGEFCKALCSKITCDGENEICYDEDGQVPGACTCAQGYARERGICKGLCSMLSCGENEVCHDGDGQFPGACTCAVGYARKGNLCKALCSMLPCGENEVCHDGDGQFPGACTCAPGYARKGKLCKALCSRLSCGRNEICNDENGKVPGSCSCATGYAREGVLCKALCSLMTCSENEICYDEDGQIPAACSCAPGYAREGELCKALCSHMTCSENEICYDEDGRIPAACSCAPGYAREGELCKGLCSMLPCGENEICYDADGRIPATCTCVSGYAREGELCKDICLSSGGERIERQCLFVNSNEINWSEAVTACAREGQQLASINNFTAVKEHMQNKDYAYNWHWVGGSDEGSEGTWYWLDGRPVPGRDDVAWWDSPTHGGTNQNCLQYRTPLGFRPESCTRDRPYICSLDIMQPSAASRDTNNGVVSLGTSPKQCPKDFFKVKDECFFIPNESFKTWHKAQAFCRSQGGFLAEPNSITDLLEALENRTSGYNFWIGKVNNMTGSTEEAHTFSGIEEGDNNCHIVMKGESNPLYKGKCDDYHLFVCENKKNA